VRNSNLLYDVPKTRDLDWASDWDLHVSSEKVHRTFTCYCVKWTDAPAQYDWYTPRPVLVVPVDLVLDLYVWSLQLQYQMMRSFYPEQQGLW
jgi:hypothetical protein